MQHWVEDRWLPPNRPRPPRAHEKRAQVPQEPKQAHQEVQANQNAEEPFKLPGQAALDRAFEEAEHSNLNLLKCVPGQPVPDGHLHSLVPCRRPDVSHYLRKTKMPDFNSLILLVSSPPFLRISRLR